MGPDGMNRGAKRGVTTASENVNTAGPFARTSSAAVLVGGNKELPARVLSWET